MNDETRGNSNNFQVEPESFPSPAPLRNLAATGGELGKRDSLSDSASPKADLHAEKNAGSGPSSSLTLPGAAKAPLWNRPMTQYDSILFAFSAWIVVSVLVLIFGSDWVNIALLTSIYLQFRSRASVNQWLLSLLLGLPILLISPKSNALFALAAGCLTVAAYRAAKKAIPLNNLLPLPLAFFTLCVAIVDAIVLHFTPRTVDARMLALDHRWFFSISTATWHWAQTHLLVGDFFYFIYLSLPCVVVLILVDLDAKNCWRLVLVLLMTSICAVPFYLLFPAVGPLHIGAPNAHRNCLPSLHLTWAIVLWRAAKPGWESWAMALFVLLTAISTLTTGEHYLIDLITALPYAACSSLAIRRKPGAQNPERRLRTSEL